MAITRVHLAFFVLIILGLDLIQKKHLLVETEDEDDKDYESDIEDEQCNKVVYLWKYEMKMLQTCLIIWQTSVGAGKINPVNLYFAILFKIKVFDRIIERQDWKRGSPAVTFQW